MSKKKYGIHWFRRDLRVAGNPALQWNWKKNEGRVVGVFFFDSKFLSRPDFSNNRFAFFLQTLKTLKAELQKTGGDLLVLNELSLEGFPRMLEYLKKEENIPSVITFNKDYEPYARERDKNIQELLSQWQIEVFTARDHLVMEPQEVLKEESQGSFYQVYSPFAKRWLENFSKKENQEKINSQKKGLIYLEKLLKGEFEKDLFCLKWKDLLDENKFEDSLDLFIKENNKNVTIQIPESGSAVAFSRLKEFKKNMDKYGEQRDFPDIDGTSQMSIFLKNGSITSAQIISYLSLNGEKITSNNFNSPLGKIKYLKEIIWREFYYSILWHNPRVEKESFIEKYNDIAWENNKVFFKNWCEGKTGFPIVDAGMRQLNETGWMHNRVRMIVASFLTKDLLIDWKWGENYFMKMLLDGDIAPNNGGWQWAASTGCDPQPYFRIFNPWLQSKKFDPEGSYIKKYIPELRHLGSDQIHEPHLHGAGKGYPLPIVNHAEQKEKALKLYKVQNVNVATR